MRVLTSDDSVAPADSQSAELLKLNIGGGGFDLPGYINVDRTHGREAYPLDYPDNSADAIHASHVLEHFPYGQTLAVLEEWTRVLKPGGRMRIAVPDVEWCARQILMDDGSAPVEGYLMGGQEDANDFHKAVFNERALRLGMLAVGLRRIKRWTTDGGECARLPVSLNLEGFKIGPVAVPKTLGIMSMPRLAFTENFRCAMNSLPKLGIDLRIGTGVFWEQALSRLLEEAIAEQFEYAITADYDSVYSGEQPLELIRLMNEHPEADAICGLQMRRETQSALMTIPDGTGKMKTRIEASDLDNELLPIFSGHFGLTIFRVSRLRDIPRPWFIGAPGSDGKYGEDRVDADVGFWKLFNREGRKLFVAPFVPVGHAELLVKWPNSGLEPMLQSFTDWNEMGIPVGVRQ